MESEILELVSLIENYILFMKNLLLEQSPILLEKSEQHLNSMFFSYIT